MAVASVLLFAMVVAAMDVAGIRGFNPFVPGSILDYSAPPFGGFFPLRAPFVNDVLGAPDLGSTGAESRTGHPGSINGSSIPRVVTHALTNDDSADAYQIASVPFTARSDTTQATRQSNDPTDCSRVGSTVWYRYRADRDGTLVATTAASYPVATGAYRQPATRSSKAIACDSDAQGLTSVAFPAFAGTTYLFQITGQVRGGKLTFSLDREPQSTPVSVLSDGRYGGATYAWGYPKVSGNGRFVVFGSGSTELDPRCAKRKDGTLPCGYSQIYIRDLLTGTTELVSLTSTGGIPNDGSFMAGVSADGRYVVWHTNADNVTADPDRVDSEFDWREGDVFLRDRKLGRTERITIAPDGSELNGGNPSISADGRFVAFQGDIDHRVNQFTGWHAVEDVYVKDRVTGGVERVSDGPGGVRGNHDSGGPIISSDGGYVVFGSKATNLSEGPNAVDDAYNYLNFDQGRVYVFDRHRKQLSLECVAEDGTPANDHCFGYNVSGDGRYSVFWSSATNLLPGLPKAPDVNQILNLYVRHRRTGHLELANVTDTGEAVSEVWRRQLPPAPCLAVDGCTVFNLSYQVFGCYWCAKRTPQPYLSNDGSIVGFDTDVALTAADKNGIIDAYVRDRTRGRTIRISETPNGNDPNDISQWPSLSADGSLVAFFSGASNLAPGDTNHEWDIFIRLWRTG